MRQNITNNARMPKALAQKFLAHQSCGLGIMVFLIEVLLSHDRNIKSFNLKSVYPILPLLILCLVQLEWNMLNYNTNMNKNAPL